MNREVRCVDGPFEGEDFYGNDPLPEYIRVHRCQRCPAAHAADESGPKAWPDGAARYALKDSEEDPAAYVFDGVGDGKPKYVVDEEAPEPVIGTVTAVDGDRVTVELGRVGA